MNLEEIWREEANWIHLAQNKAGLCEHGNESSRSMKYEEFLDW
jgi:hypothetical protein